MAWACIGAVPEDLQYVGSTHAGSVQEGCHPLGGTPMFEQGKRVRVKLWQK